MKFGDYIHLPGKRVRLVRWTQGDDRRIDAEMTALIGKIGIVEEVAWSQADQHWICTVRIDDRRHPIYFSDLEVLP